MNVSKICSLGYFDRFIIDGYTMPMFKSRGIAINDLENIKDSMSNREDSSQCLGRIRINFIGEANFDMKDDQLLGMRFHRENVIGLSRTKLGNVDRYNIGYADITIFKREYTIDKNYNDIKDELQKAARSEDEALLFSKALEIQYNNRQYKDCNIAIIDKVYIHKHFRGCGISKWFHNNILDIIKIYDSLLDIQKDTNLETSSSISTLLNIIKNPPEVTDDEVGVIARSKEYINNCFNKDICLNDVAEFVFLSPAYFSRLFKQETGENFIDYLIKVRMENAKKYLHSTIYKTYEISQMVGYKKSKYFSKLFRKYTGFTPTEYRTMITHEKQKRELSQI